MLYNDWLKENYTTEEISCMKKYAQKMYKREIRRQKKRRRRQREICKKLK